MKNLIFLTFIFVALTSKTIVAQTDTVLNSENCVDFFIVNSFNPKKKIKLSSNRSIFFPRLTLTLNARPEDSSIISNKYTYENIFLNRLNDTKLNFEYQNEQIEYLTDNEEYTNYFNYSKYKNKVIDLGDLSEIKYLNTSKNTLFGIGYFTMSMSFFTSAIIAPLVSINYKNGDFNKDRYYKVAGSGLIGMGASIPFLCFGKSKKYKMTQYGLVKDKELWYLEMHNKKDPSKK